MLGHSIQACSKLNANTRTNENVPIHPKVHSVNNNTRPKGGLIGKNAMNAPRNSMLPSITNDRNQSKGKPSDAQQAEHIT